MSRGIAFTLRALNSLGTRWLPFADAASPELPSPGSSAWPSSRSRWGWPSPSWWGP
jgi:hypothetical protein